MEFTLMKNEISYIEDIIPKQNSEETETPEKDEEIQESQNKENEGDNLGKKISEIGEKDKFDFNLDRDKNPFTGVLIGGGITAGAGVGAAIGSIAACIAFDSVVLVTGEFFTITTAGFTFLGGAAVTGLGLVVAVPSLIGFGAYKIYKNVKNKEKKKFFDDLNLEKKKIEKEFQNYVICKIDNYFNKRIIIENNDEIEKYINNIIDIYLSIDNQIIESNLDLEQNKLLKKIQKDGKIVSMNISKIRQELMKTIIGNSEKKFLNIFKKGIPLFKEFIKNFGPIKIGENNENDIDKNISKIIDIMGDILEKKMEVSFNKFDTKHFINSFDFKLEELYEDKKKLEDISKKDFINKCKEYIIEPIANNSQNYGVLSLYFKFTLIIQKICANKKANNFNIMKEKIINHNQTNKQINNQNKNLSNNQNNGFAHNPTFNPDMNQNDLQQSMTMISQNYLMQGMKSPSLSLKQNIIDNAAPLILDKSISLNKEIVTNNNDNLNQNQYINIEFIINNGKIIIIQGTLDMTEEELIQRFKIEICDVNIIINKYLINNKIELNPGSKKTLKELGITSDLKIIVTSD